MMHIRRQLLVTIVVPLAILLLLVASVARLSMDTRAAALAAARSSHALDAGELLLVTLVDAETGMRGYVLTGERRFAEPYFQARSSFAARLAAFQSASADDPQATVSAREVAIRARASLQLVGRYVDLVDAGSGSRARREVATGLGKAKMDAFRRALAQYVAAADFRAGVTSTDLSEAWKKVYTLLELGTLVAIVAVCVLYIKISRNLMERLQRLQDRASIISLGRGPTQTVTGNDEIARVERAFEEMAAKLTVREDALVRSNALQQTILNTTHHAIITTGADGTITSFNHGAERMLDLSASDVVGRRAPDLDDETHSPAAAGLEYLLSVMQMAHIEQREWTFARVDGVQIPVTATVLPLLDDEGLVFGYVGIMEDISERKAAEEATRRSEAEQRDFAGQLQSLHLIANNAAVEQDPIARSLQLGLEQLGLQSAFVGLVDEERRNFVIDHSVGPVGAWMGHPIPSGTQVRLDQTFIGTAATGCEVYAVEDFRGTAGTAELPAAFGDSQTYIAAPIYVGGTIYGVICFLGNEARTELFSGVNRRFVRVTADLVGASIERSRQRARLDGMAFFDALTGLPNRVLFLDRLSQTVLAAKRYLETFAVLYLDLDGFKAINDSYGHAVGDKVLIATARRLEMLMRTSDTVARLGGDEFVVLAPKLGAVVDARDLAVRVVEAMRRPIVIGTVEHSISVSIGIAVYPEDGIDGTTLLDGADRALYAAKARGKDTFSSASRVFGHTSARAIPVAAAS